MMRASVARRKGCSFILISCAHNFTLHHHTMTAQAYIGWMEAAHTWLTSPALPLRRDRKSPWKPKLSASVEKACKEERR